MQANSPHLRRMQMHQISHMLWGLHIPEAHSVKSACCKLNRCLFFKKKNKIKWLVASSFWWMITLLLYFLIVIAIYIPVEHLEILLQIRLTNLGPYLSLEMRMISKSHLVTCWASISTPTYSISSSSSSSLPRFSSFFFFLSTLQILLAECGAICKRLSWKEYVGKKKHIEVSPKKEGVVHPLWEVTMAHNICGYVLQIMKTAE